MRPLIIYHGGGCLDGFASALAAYCHFQHLAGNSDIEYIPASHGDPPPDVTGADVYLLDFCYPRPVMEGLCRQAERVTVLDHHISAMEACEGLDQQFANLRLYFDMSRSGAVISWEYFHSTPVPWLFRYVQDRDLWQWQYPETKAVTAGLASHAQRFDLWQSFAFEADALKDLIADGEAISRYREQEIAVYKRRLVLASIAGYRVPVVNCPTSIVSELLSDLARGYPFAAAYMDKPEQRVWSLRSSEEGEDVAKVAGLFGGGGHAKAAGFSTPLDASTRHLEPRA